MVKPIEKSFIGKKELQKRDSKVNREVSEKMPSQELEGKTGSLYILLFTLQT